MPRAAAPDGARRRAAAAAGAAAGLLVPLTAAGAGPPSLPGARGCPVFTATNVWNRPVASLPSPRARAS
jgi:hypothetical protein